MVSIVLHRIMTRLLLLVALSSPLFAAPAAGKFMYLLAQMTSKEEGKAEEAWTMLSTSLDPRAHAVLMAGLAHKDARIRGYCASLLAYRKDPGAAAALLPRLRDPDVKVRIETVRLLGDLGDPDTRKALDGLLSDPDAGVRAVALNTLGRSRDDACDIMLQALLDPSTTVRQTAIRQLSLLKDPRAVAPLAAIARGTDRKERDAAISTLGKIGLPSLDALLGLLSSVEVEVRRGVIGALTGIDDPRAQEVVHAAMMDNDAGIRQMVFSNMCSRGDAEARAMIFAAFSDRSSPARDQVVPMLKVYGGDEEYFQGLISLIADLDFELEWPLPYALRDSRDPRLVEPLLARLSRPMYPPEVISILGKQRDARAVPALIALLSSTKTLTKDPHTGENVYQEQADEDYSVLVWDNSSPASRASEALIDIGTPAVEGLLAALRSENPRVRARAAQTLGEIPDPRTLPALLETLQDPDVKVQRAAVMALGTLGDARGYEALIARLDEKDQEIREAIIEALSDSRDPRLIPLYMKMAQSKDEWDRSLAVSALGEMDDPRVVPVMLRALRDRSDEVRYTATFSSGWSTDPRAADGLVGMLGDRDENVRRNAGDLLREMETAVVAPALVKALRSRNLLIRAGSADVASAHRDPRLTAALLEALTDPVRAVRSDAAYALEEAHDPAIRPHIERLLANPPYLDTRRECIRLLGSVGATDRLLTMLATATRPQECKAIISALSATGDLRALEALTAALDDPDSDTRYYAVSGLARMKDGRATQLLLRSQTIRNGDDTFVLEQSDIPVPAELLQPFFTGPSATAAYTMNTSAIRIAGKQEERWAIEAMLEMLAVLTRCPERNSAFCVNHEALIKALGDLREARAVEMIAVALDDDDLDAVAAEALGKIGGTQAADVLLSSLAKHRDYYQVDFLRTTGQALGGIKDRHERERLTAAAQSGSWRIRCGAVYALGASGEAWAIPPALATLSDPQPQVRAAAAEALGRLKAEEAVPALTKALSDLYPEVRKAAKQALAAIVK
ncbi:MAG: HEAT repeat domain-containing protein [Armatimonadota bacterium]